jgi:hypothetical protein
VLPPILADFWTYWTMRTKSFLIIYQHMRYK